MRRRAGATLIALLALAAPVQAGDLVFFHAPSRNIWCMGETAGGDTPQAYVACDILEVTRRTVRIPQPADCEFGWGGRFSVAEAGRAGLVCYSDALVDDSSRVLEYGQAIRVGGVSCASSSAGLECRNSQQHGFFLSRKRQDLF